MAFETSNLPTLATAEFSAIVDREAHIRNSLRRIHPTPSFLAEEVVDPSVVDLCLALALRDKFPDALPDAVALLYEAFRPSSSSARLSIIRHKRWTPPNPRAGELVTTSSLLSFLSDFRRLLAALDIPELPATKIVLDSLRGDVARLARAQFELAAPTSIREVCTLAIDCARRVDAAHSDGLLPSRSIPSTPSTPINQHSTPRQFRSVPHQVICQVPSKLTPAEYNRCIAEGRCLRCRQLGHMASNCPTFRSTPQVARPAGADTTPKPQPPTTVVRRSDRLENPPKRFDPSPKTSSVSLADTTAQSSGRVQSIMDSCSGAQEFESTTPRLPTSASVMDNSKRSSPASGAH